MSRYQFLGAIFSKNCSRPELNRGSKIREERKVLTKVWSISAKTDETRRAPLLAAELFFRREGGGTHACAFNDAASFSPQKAVRGNEDDDVALPFGLLVTP